MEIWDSTHGSPAGRDAAEARNPGSRPSTATNPAAELATQSVRAGPASPPQQQRQAPPGFAPPAHEDPPPAAAPPQTAQQQFPAEAMLRGLGSDVHAIAGGPTPNGVATGEQAASHLFSNTPPEVALSFCRGLAS